MSVSQSSQLCTVVCIEIVLLCTEILMSSENILKLTIYSVLSNFQKPISFKPLVKPVSETKPNIYFVIFYLNKPLFTSDFFFQ